MREVVRGVFGSRPKRLVEHLGDADGRGRTTEAGSFSVKLELHCLPPMLGKLREGVG